MLPSRLSFADELIKLGEGEKDEKKKSNLKGYLGSMALGAVAVPGIKSLSRRVERMVSNKMLRAAAAKAPTPAAAEALLAKVERGPHFGPHIDVAPNMRPAMSLPEIIGDGSRGAMSGGALQYVRDRLLGRE